MIAIRTSGMLLMLLLVRSQMAIHVVMMMGSRLRLLLLMVMVVRLVLMRMLMGVRRMVLWIKVIVQLVEAALAAIGKGCPSTTRLWLLMRMDGISGEGLFRRYRRGEIVVHRGKRRLATTQVEWFLWN